MDFADTRPSRLLVYLTVCISLLVHLVALFAPLHAAKKPQPATRLSARIAPKPPLNTPVIKEALAPKPVPPAKGSAVRARRPPAPMLTAKGPATAAVEEMPKHTQAERDDINNFLNSLGAKDTARPTPTPNSLAQRSMAMARDLAKNMAREGLSQQGSEGAVSIERIPGSPPIDRFSLDFYLDALVTKFNRSASFVKRPKPSGTQTAAMELRINPDGTVKSLEVLEAGDQPELIEYIKRLVERSAPYSPFPQAMAVSAKSMSILICIKPGQGDGLGFSRHAGNSWGGC